MQNTASLFVRGLRQTQRPLQQASRKRTWQRSFHASRRLDVVKPFILADIGEGITEVQIIQWFVQPGARVEQFDKLCEVQSDKASVEITSRFDGVIKKLHYEQDDTAKVGKALCDIDIEGEVAEEDAALLTPDSDGPAAEKGTEQAHQAAEDQQQQQQYSSIASQTEGKQGTFQADPPSERSQRHSGAVSSLATPAVRGLLKELGVKIEEVQGTGRDGRVLKEDVRSFVAARDSQSRSSGPGSAGPSSFSQTPILPTRTRPTIDDGPQRETPAALTPIQSQMFKAMTRSLSIPHFLYADEINLSALSSLRSKLNALPSSPGKLSFLPFIIKAVSLSLYDFPLLNARVDAPSADSTSSSSTISSSSSSSSPTLVMREKHNIGVAMDTPKGLLVPNIKNVGALSIREIAAELSRLQGLAQQGKLGTADLSGGTITVSNIGSIGGTYVSPVIVQGEVAILGIGKARAVPAFASDDVDNTAIVRRTVANFSWSADHRVVDGATMARMGERVRALLEEPATMMADLR